VTTCAVSKQPNEQPKPKAQPTPQSHEEVVTPKNTPQQQLNKKPNILIGKRLILQRRSSLSHLKGE
jgi:hypothetical protein